MGVETLPHAVQQHSVQHSLFLTSASGGLLAAFRSISTETEIDDRRVLLSELVLPDVLRKPVGWVVFTLDLLVDQPLFAALSLAATSSSH